MNVAPFNPADLDYFPPGEPVKVWRNGHDARAQKRFELIPFDKITMPDSSEWRIKKIFPECGVGLFYGKSMTLKSFLAADVNLHVAIGWNWAGRTVKQSPAIYIAAEGAAGVRKRKVGFELHHAEHLPDVVPFFLIEAAPNLGTGQDDLNALIAAVELAGVTPGIVTIDTLAQTLGGGEENGAGMQQVIANAQALANHFKCFVLVIHHSGLADDDRPRGWSGLKAALDVVIRFERKEGTLTTALTIQKLKDEDDRDVTFEAQLLRIIIGRDDEKEEISTLIVETVRKTEATKPCSATKAIPRSQRLLMTVIKEAIEEAGIDFKPFAEGPMVTGVEASIVRKRLYSRIAEKAEEDDDPVKIAARQRKAFSRAVEAEIKAKALMSAIHNGARVLWLP
jgi:AAA domain